MADNLTVQGLYDLQNQALRMHAAISALTLTNNTSPGLLSDASKAVASFLSLAGVSGASAYDLAVTAGYTGTLAQWLASLKGAAGTSAPKPTTLRNIATKCRINNAKEGTGFPYLSSRVGHINEGSHPIESIQVAFANQYTLSNTGEVANDAATFLWSIEYPAGTFTRVKWAGQETLAAAGSNTLLLSDNTALPVAIPVGATFWTKNLQYCSTGVVHAMGSTNSTYTGDFGFASASAPTDNTMLAANQNNATWSLAPLCLLAYSSKPAVLLVGDSIQAGYAETSSTTPRWDFGRGNWGIAARQIGSRMAYSNLGIPGETTAQFNASHSLRVAISPYFTHMHSNYGINDLIVNNSTVAVVEGLLSTTFSYYSNLGLKVSCQTLLPCVTSSDSLYTTNQTVKSFEANRVSLNTDMRARNGVFGNTWCVFDVADSVESARNSGLWKVDVDGLRITGDGTHPNAAGCDLSYRAAPVRVASFVV